VNTIHPFSFQVATSPEVLFRIVGDEAVLLNLKSEQYLGLDPVGTRMWVLLHEQQSINAAYDALLAEFEVTPDRLRQDLDEFVGKLQAHGLIQLTEKEAS
jgi:hypothetical protein